MAFSGLARIFGRRKSDCESFSSTLRETINMLQKLPPQGIPEELKRTILQISDEGDPTSGQQ